MSDTPELVKVDSVTLAVTEAFTKQSEIGARIQGLFDSIYAWLPESGIEQAGHNSALYDQFSADGMRMRVGFPISKRFVDNREVRCIELSEGRAAHLTHRGAYSGLPAAHNRLLEWCRQHSFQLAGGSWEVYGDWSQDESGLVTEVYIRLAGDGGLLAL